MRAGRRATLVTGGRGREAAGPGKNREGQSHREDAEKAEGEGEAQAGR